MVVESRNVIDDSGCFNLGHNGQRHGSVDRVSHRNQTFVFLHFIGNREHLPCHTIELCNHVVCCSSLLLQRCRIRRQDIADIISRRRLGMVDQGFHGKVIVITTTQNNVLHPCKGEVIGAVDDAADDVGHIRVGAFQGSIGVRLGSIQTEYAFRNNGRKRGQQNNDHRQEQAHADQDLVERMPHCPGCRKHGAPGTTRGSAGRNFCNCFTAFYASLNGCRCGIGSSFRAFRGSVGCCLFRYFSGSLCSLSGGLSKIVLTITKLLLCRFCHYSHLLYFWGNKNRP